jgi:hypothetical protein
MHQEQQQFIFQDFQVKKISLGNQMIKWIFDPVETVMDSLASMRDPIQISTVIGLQGALIPNWMPRHTITHSKVFI